MPMCTGTMLHMNLKKKEKCCSGGRWKRHILNPFPSCSQGLLPLQHLQPPALFGMPEAQDKAHSALQRIKAQQVLSAAGCKRSPLHYPCTQPAYCRSLSEWGSGAPVSLTPSLSSLSVQHAGSEQVFA